MKRRRSYSPIKLIVLGLLILCGCSTEEREYNYFKNFAKTKRNLENVKDKNTIFPEALNIINEENKRDFFYKIPNNSIVVNNIKFELFLLRSNDDLLPGYWGERENEVFFIPYKYEKCSDIFLLFNWESDGYFNLSEPNCDYYDYTSISNGYSFKVARIDESRYEIMQFSNPMNGIDISENEYIETANLLKMIISKSQGILEFSYDFSPKDDYLIPWVIK